MRSIVVKIFLPICFLFSVKANAFNHKPIVSKETTHPIYFLPNTDSNIKDSIETLLNNIKSKNAWVSVIDIQRSFDSSFGMLKVVSGINYELAFKSIDFTKTTATSRVFARVTLPQKNSNGSKKALYFQGFITLSRTGGLISDGKLTMIGNDTITKNDNWMFVVNGSTSNAASNPTNPTYLQMDCNGYKQLSINGSVVLSPVKFKPVSIGNTAASLTTPAIGSFNQIIPIWDSLYSTNVTFNKAFTPKNVPHFIFNIKAATFDFNDNRNPANNKDITSYINEQIDDLPNTWKGLSITNVEISLPEWFKNRNNSNRVTLNTSYGVIDAVGFSTKVKSANLLSITDGTARGWPFSVDSLEFNIDDSLITQGSFKGKVILPITDRNVSDSRVGYIGSILDSTYKVSIGSQGFGTVRAEIWKAGLEVDNCSALSMEVKNNEFYPKATLSGKYVFHNNGEKVDIIETPEERAKNNKPSFYSIDDATFEELTLQTERPFLKAKSFSAGGAMKISGFEANVGIEYDREAAPSDAVSNVDYAGLDFFGQISFMNGKFSGGLDLAFFGEYDQSKSEWKFHSAELKSVAVSADFGKMGFSGAVDFFKQDSVYGNGFSGKGSLKFADYELTASLMLGNHIDTADDSNNYQYWSADASVTGLNINLDGLIIEGFSGGASYHMDPVDKPNPRFLSGVQYQPTRETFLRFRAGIFLSVIDKHALSGWAGLEMAFNRNGGLKEIGLSGVGQILSSNGVDKTKTNIKPTTRGRRNAIVVNDNINAETEKAASTKRRNAISGIENNPFATTSTTNGRRNAVANIEPPPTETETAATSNRGRRNAVANIEPPPTETETATTSNRGRRNAVANIDPPPTEQDANKNLTPEQKSKRADSVRSVLQDRLRKADSLQNTAAKATRSTSPYPDQPNGTFMWGDFNAMMDIENEVFTLNMNVYANYQNIIVGVGDGGLLGNLDMLISATDWHLYVGRKTQPNGIKLNLPYLGDVSATSYFEMGNDINKDAKVDFALRFGFGYNFNLNKRFGPLYAYVDAGINFDMYAQRKDNFTCNNSSAGIYGWYGSASAAAHMYVKVGLDFSIWDEDFRFDIFNGGIDASLEVRGPNPLYAKGHLRFHWCVGWWIFEHCETNETDFEYGTYCPF